MVRYAQSGSQSLPLSCRIAFTVPLMHNYPLSLEPSSTMWAPQPVLSNNSVLLPCIALYDSQALPLTELKNHIQAPCKPMYPDSRTRRPFPPSSVSSHPFWPASSCLFMSSAAAHATAPCPVSADASPGGTHISSSPPPPHQPIFYSGPLASACPPSVCTPTCT